MPAREMPWVQKEVAASVPTELELLEAGSAAAIGGRRRGEGESL
jgi:hypothetical protein